MNRLTVRLSIVGAVLTLGAAAVALRMFSGDAPQAAEDTVDLQQVAQVNPAEPATPIRTDEIGGQEPTQSLQAPPSSAFSRYRPMRTVSHENPTDEDAQTVPTADPIPTLSGDGAQDPAYSAYGSPSSTTSDSRANGAADERSGANSSGANSGGAFMTYDPPAPAATAGTSVPEAPSYGSVADGTAEPSTGARQNAAASAAADTQSPPPSSSFPIGKPAQPSKTPASQSFPLPSTPAATDHKSDAAAPVVSGAALLNLRRGVDDAAGGTSGALDRTSGASGALDRSSGANSAPDRTNGATGALDRTNSASGTTLSPGPDMMRAAGTYPSTDDRLGADPYPSTTSSDSPRLPAHAGADSSAALAAGAAASNMTMLSSNVPGDRALEGQQSPAIVLEKTAPEEIQVERKATFQIRVRNVGNTTAHNVVVIDQVPRGTEYIDAVPQCAHTPDGLLVWNMPTLRASEEVILSVNLLPKVAGEIGSVAQVTFQAQAAVRTVCTKPQLALELKMPEQVLIGTPAAMEIVVTNTGSGAATNVVLEEDVPDGFTHAAGRQLEHAIGTLLPQESRRLSLALDATKPGVYENRLTVHGDGNLLEEDVRKIEVATPKLEISMQGPALRYLDRQATYVVRMANPGTAPARNIELVTYLPKGMKYVTSDNHGQYDSQTHAVYWSLEELPAEKQGDVHLTVLPIEPGNHRLKADGRAELGLQHSCEHEVVVEGLAETSFSVTDVADPIEVGSDTTYEIRVHNRGSKADSDIRVVAELPPGMTPTAGDGPVPATVQGQRVVFNSLTRLAPDEEAVFKIHATGQATGDHIVRVQLQSADLRVPVTKEEITRVYTDQ